MLILLSLVGAAGAATAEDVAEAMGVPEGDLLAAELDVFDADRSVAVMDALGILDPTEGESLAWLFTGDTASWPTTGRDTDLGAGGQADDLVTLTLTLQVPDGVSSLFYEFFFLSAEYPAFVGSTYNDRFLCEIDSGAYSGNAAVDRAGNAMSVNSNLFTVTLASDLQGTGFDLNGRGGGTGWLLNAVPVVPGEVVNVSFTVYDEADGVYDSGVLLDNFYWSDFEISYPVIVEPIEIFYHWPKRDTLAGGEVVTIWGDKFSELCRVSIGGVEAETAFIDDEIITAVVPPASAVGPVDASVDCAGDVEVILDAITYYQGADTRAAPPIISGVAPAELDVAGGQSVTITGEAFEEGLSATLDGEALSVTRVDEATLTFTAPAHAAGLVDLAVLNPSGLSDTRYGALYYSEEPRYEVPVEDTGGDGGEAPAADTGEEGEGKGCATAPGVAGLAWLLALVAARRRT